MRRYISRLVFVVLVALLSGCALESRKAEGAASVWKVEHGKNVMYIGGSMHILREADYPLPRAFESAFAASKVLVLEADIDDAMSADFLQKLQSRLHLADGATLETVLDKDAYALIVKNCPDPLILRYINTLEPGAAVSILELERIKKIGWTETGVDEYFYNKAKDKKRRVEFLESLIFQADMLFDIAKDDPSGYVRYSFSDDYDDENSALFKMAAAWRGGEVAVLVDLLAKEAADFPDYYNALVKSRNDAWMDRLYAYLETGEAEFVVVGLLHLYGKDGIITQLQNQGYAVTQMRG